MATTEAVRVAGFGLPGSDGPIAAGDWDRFLSEVRREQLTGLAVAAAEAGVLEVDERRAADLLGAHRDAMVWALGLERLLLRLDDAFAERGIGFVVMKGTSLAHTLYPDPSWRPFGDLDLLVRTRDWPVALGVLCDLGFSRRLPEPRRGFDQRFGKAATHRTPDRQEIDLHRTLVLGPFGLWTEPEVLIDRAVWFTVAGRRLRRLDATGTFIEACVHAALGLRHPPLLTVRDVAQSLETGGIDWDAVARWSRDWHLAPVIERGLRLAAESFGTAWPVEAARALRPATRAERRAVEAYTTERRARGGTAVATLRAIRGVRGKTAYVRAMALPDRGFTDRRPGRWRRPAAWLVGRR